MYPRVVNTAKLQLEDDSGTAFNDTSLTNIDHDFAKFSSTYLSITGTDMRKLASKDDVQEMYEITGHLTSLEFVSIQSVPVPPNVLMCAITLGLYGCFFARKQKKERLSK